MDSTDVWVGPFDATTVCALCHYNTALTSQGRPDLGVNSATNLETPNNLIQVILDGMYAPEGITGVVMPGFNGALSDTEITAIAAYLHDNRVGQQAWPNLAKTVVDLCINGPTAH
jgi:mono/diheme cytochrome c family protein